MKSIRSRYSLIVCLLSVSLPIVAMAKPTHKPHKEIVHFFAQQQMTSSGVVSNAAGHIDLHENSVSQGKPQELRIQVQNLSPNTAYSLMARVGDDTNSTQIVNFITDAQGNANLDFRDKLHGNGPHNRQPVPIAVSPLTNIRELDITDGSGQTVLSADLGAAHFVFFLKQDLSTADLVALLQVNANNHSARLRLSASGLGANTDYSLALNGTTVTTATTDDKGRLQIGWELQNASDVLSLQTVALVDGGGNSVVSATLP